MMRCVILAAGEGERLKQHEGDLPKPLHRILGMPLIERTLLTLSDAGIDRFFVVTGYRSSAIEDSLGDGSRYGVTLEYQFNPEWSKGNGSSLQVLSDKISENERFLVTMADHIFQPEAVKAFVAHASEAQGLFLLTDTRVSRVRNLADATKVDVMPDATIKVIGKDLRKYDRIDCGLFCLDYDIFRALAEASRAERCDLSDGINYLVNNSDSKVRTVDIGDFYWQDIDEYEDIASSEKMMLSALGDPKDGIVSRYVNRRISIPITKRISRFSISPNQISLLVFLLGVFSGALFFVGRPLLGGLLAQANSILDGVDGEIARLKHAQSTIGGLLDSLGDRYVDILIIAGFAYFAYARTQSRWVLLLGTVTLAAVPLSMALKDRFRLLFARPYNSNRMDGMVRFLLPNRDGRLFLVMIGGVLPGFLLPVLFTLALTSNIQIITRILLIRKQLGRQEGEDPALVSKKFVGQNHSDLDRQETRSFRMPV